MKPLILFIFTATLFTSSCLKSESEKRTITYFEKHIKADMKYTDIKHAFGEPDEVRGVAFTSMSIN